VVYNIDCLKQAEDLTVTYGEEVVISQNRCKIGVMVSVHPVALNWRF